MEALYSKIEAGQHMENVCLHTVYNYKLVWMQSDLRHCLRLVLIVRLEVH